MVELFLWGIGFTPCSPLLPVNRRRGSEMFELMDGGLLVSGESVGLSIVIEGT